VRVFLPRTPETREQVDSRANREIADSERRTGSFQDYFSALASANGYEHDDYFESELDSERIVI